MNKIKFHPICFLPGGIKGFDLFRIIIFYAIFSYANVIR